MDVKTADAALLQTRYRLTRQRSGVLHALGDGAHLTAEAILERVRSEQPQVSLGTVYRTLEILRGLGLVQVFTPSGGASLYEAALDKHHHLLCTRCREVRNVTIQGLGMLASETAGRLGFDDVDYAMTITGRCPSCSSEESPGAA
jgi:Fe2+ or Zn2+ uptake regulation protein